MRNKKAVRAAALVMAALLTASPAASASQALGTELHRGSVHLAQGVDYTRQYLWSATYSDLRTERYLVYTPNELVQPAVVYGDHVLSKSTLTEMAQTLEAQGKRVLGGVNGDYFVMSSGAPLGVVITDGVLRSTSAGHYALGFDEQGNAMIGMPSLTVSVGFGGQVYAASDLNKARGDTTGYILYTDEFRDTTLHSDPGVDVILSPADGAWDLPEDEEELEDWLNGALRAEDGQDALLTVGGSLSCTVEQVLQSDGPIEIPKGRLVLSVNNKSGEQLVSALAALLPGDRVDISVTTPDSRWENVVTAIGGLYKMVTAGAVEPGLETTQAPRTAVGIRADGSVIFYTVDGRQSGYSVGASMNQVAERLVELGCVEAMCLDGGGSTTFGATLPGQDGFGVLNSPSDGSQRAITNALFLVTDRTLPGEAESLSVTPGDAILFPGGSLELSAVAVDARGQAVLPLDADELVFDVPDGGSVSGGVLTAGTLPGTYPVSAFAGGLTGGALFTVVPGVDQITVRNEDSGAAVTALSLEPGQQVRLTAEAVYRNLKLTSSDTDFTWTVTEGLGTVDPDGTFTAGETGGAGTLTVSAGGRSAEVALSIANHIYTVEDFEGGFEAMTDSSTAGIRPENRSAYIRYGAQSAQVTYNTMGVDYAAVGLPLTFREGENWLSLWVYGDGTGSTLTMPVRMADGGSSDLVLTRLDFTGWKRVAVPLPGGATGALMLKIEPTGGDALGMIWLDQITTSNQPEADLTPPTVTAELSGSSLSAVLSDDMDAGFSDGQVSVTYDGRPLRFTLNGNAVAAVLPENDGRAHRVTVTAVDASGNIGRSSVDVPAGAERQSPFTDTADHWAGAYADYLYDQEIATGVAVGDQLQFQPGREITRGEFAALTARWLRLDLSAYSAVELPFADVGAIPAWCLDAIKAMYDLGYMQGATVGDALYANAGQPISRIEAMTLLGRIQPKGYATAELTFADAADVPAWGAEYVQTMVAQGVISGTTYNTVLPNVSITRGETVKILYTLW